ncbi:leucine-rich repeat domain, L domain-like protein [Tanacetum coccineum]
MFSGEMPSSMSDMHSLNDLDVSFNNLSGRVPSSTQLQSFPPERFTGNVGLCGLPTTTKCLEDEDQGVPPIGDCGDVRRWFYIGGATGFATAFWIACSALLLNLFLRLKSFFVYATNSPNELIAAIPARTSDRPTNDRPEGWAHSTNQ